MTDTRLTSILRNAIVGGALLCAGCGQPASDAPTASSDAPAAQAESHEGHSHEGHEHEGDAAAIAEAMAKLSPEDRALAEKQKVCVVAKEPLGSMGTPIKVEHNGEVAFLCCSGCKEAFEADPDKFLAALKADGEAAAVPAAEGETAPATEGEPAPATEPAAEAKSEGA
jgi:hypothetical protein